MGGSVTIMTEAEIRKDVKGERRKRKAAVLSVLILHDSEESEKNCVVIYPP